MKKCPCCASSDRRRTRRNGFIRYIPLVKSYYCLECGKKYHWISVINSAIKAKT